MEKNALAQKTVNARVLRDAKGIATQGGFYMASRNFASENTELVRLVLEEIDKIGAYSAQAVRNFPTPDTGSVKQDLCEILQQMFTVLTTTTVGASFTGLIAEAQMDPNLAEAFREQFIASRRKATRTILEQGMDRGELRPDLNLELVIDGIYGPIWYRLLLKHAPLDDVFAEELVNLLISGIQM